MKKDNYLLLVSKIKKSGSSILVIGPLFFPKKVLLSTLKEHNPTLILFIDRGSQHLKNIPLKYKNRSLSVGDGDSCTDGKLDITLNPKKDFSDLDFVIDCIIKARSTNQISALGFCACHEDSVREERYDHFLFNLGSFSKLSSKIDLALTVDQNFIFLPRGKNLLNFSGTFSIISLRNQKIKIYGDVEYSLKKWTNIHAISSLGLSNIAFGNVIIENSLGLVLYKAF